MKWTGLNELREKYLSFFESKDHLRLQSFSLIPKNDNSLLLINSGMAPMKKYFTGEITPPAKRVTTCQKCIRTPDIERVGITARHGTYFEMLGNFSFGDYFKHEAISWAWEFCTEILELPIDRLWISIYEEDDEAFSIWAKEIGVSPERIVRLGKADNFWEHGAGPCGPCSEIYFDRGEQYGCDSKNCGVGCDCDRYVEFWNLVFTQFNNDGNDHYTPLEHPNIDTGMGLERLACIMQGVDNLFLVDTVQNIMNCVCKIANVAYGENEKVDISLRVVTDHIRSISFMIADGVLPSNEGRGYVLRRLLRRAARHGKLLGIDGPFLVDVADVVIKENKTAYPELWEKKDFIRKLIGTEEQSFAKTIDQGLQLLTSLIDNADFDVLSGKEAFRLNDTFGFPLDLTKEIIAERGMTVDEGEFHELLRLQKERARAARKNAGADAWKSEQIDFSGIPATDFVGYQSFSVQAEVLAIIKDGEFAQDVFAGDKVILVLNKTPFYAESGGQIGDQGVISCGGAMVGIVDTRKNSSGIYLHSAVINAGVLSVRDIVNAQIDREKRLRTMRNHTAAHLLQAALRKVLGTHVEQAGQFVDNEHVRFDFTHFSALAPEQVAKIEHLVNEQILKGIEVINKEMPIDEARKLGAMALFGEKYGDIVRVVRIDDFSIEFCGGTHIDNTAKLGMFKIAAETSVASGVRRIEAVTGEGVLKMLHASLQIIKDSAAALKLSNSEDLAKRCRAIVTELKEKDKKIEQQAAKIAAMKVEPLFGISKMIDGIRIITADFSEEEDCSADTLKSMCNRIKETAPKSAAVLACNNGGKLLIAAAVGKEAQKRGVHAGKIVKEVAKITGGNGGGRPDIAMAGAKSAEKIEEALMSIQDIVLNMIQKN